MRFDAHTRLAEPVSPVILDGVMYLENTPHSGGGAGRSAVDTPRCPVRPDALEFGIVHRRTNSPRYY